jgi:hypothetical protein
VRKLAEMIVHKAGVAHGTHATHLETGTNLKFPVTFPSAPLPTKVIFFSSSSSSFFFCAIS